MAVVTLTATRRGPNAAHGHGGAGNLKVEVATVEVGSADSATSTYDFVTIPANARIISLSRCYWDDLASAGAPTMDFGIKSGSASITALATALSQDHDVATVNTVGKNLLTEIANSGKTAWELAGASTEPNGTLTVYGSLLDAAVNVGGTVTVEVMYLLD